MPSKRKTPATGAGRAGSRAATQGNVSKPTLGPVVCDWIESYLVHGPGDIQGTPIELDDEFRAFIWRCYEIHQRDHPLEGRRCYRRAVLSRPKGRAKSELAGMIAVAELLGPVRFDGWDENGDPVGAPITSPVIRCFATEVTQAGNTFQNALYMVEHGSVFDEYPGLDPGLTRINYEPGGSIISTTSSAGSKDGGKDTFNVFDETHLWMTPRLKALHATVTRNLVKRKIADGWALETSTMYCPGEESVAEETHKAGADLPTVLFDHKQAPLDIDIKNDDELRAALKHVYGPAAAWMNIDSIIQDEFRNPTKRESECRRYWLNQPWSMEEKFLTPSEWDACSDESKSIPAGERVVLGFDGSRSDDSTALVAVSYGSGTPHLQVAGLWEKPDGPAGEGWRVPRLRVMETIRECCRKWRVLECTADPAWWAQTLEELADEGIPITEFPQTGLRMIPATKRMYDLVQCRGLTHDGDPSLRKHVLNAVVRPEERGFRLFKDKKSSENKIDLAIAAVMALERAAAHEEVEAPTVWSIREVIEQMQQDGEVPPSESDDEVRPDGVRFIRFT